MLLFVCVWCHRASENRSKLNFSFLVLCYSCEKEAPKKKGNKTKKGKNKLKLNLLDVLENQELDQKADQSKSHEEAIPVLQDNENIINLKKGVLNVAFKKGKILARIKDSERFADMLK